ncbi:MAG: hypothetical protein WAX66_03485, partial [Patescibacteria group bacterium]
YNTAQNRKSLQSVCIFSEIFEFIFEICVSSHFIRSVKASFRVVCKKSAGGSRRISPSTKSVDGHFFIKG